MGLEILDGLGQRAADRRDLVPGLGVQIVLGQGRGVYQDHHAVRHGDEVGGTQGLEPIRDVVAHPLVHVPKGRRRDVFLVAVRKIAGEVDALEHGHGEVVALKVGHGLGEVALRGHVAA